MTKRPLDLAAWHRRMAFVGWVLIVYGCAALVGGQLGQRSEFPTTMWDPWFSLQAMFSVFLVVLGLAFRYAAVVGARTFSPAVPTAEA